MKTKIFSMTMAVTMACCAGSTAVQHKNNADVSIFILRKLDTIAVKACGISGPRTPVKDLDFTPLINSMGFGCESRKQTSIQLLLSDGAKTIFDYEVELPTCYVIVDMHGERGEFFAAHPGGVQYGCIRRNQHVWSLDFGTVIQE